MNDASQDWVPIVCERCGEPFYVRASRVSEDEIRPLKCSPCRQDVGHKTAVKWPRALLAQR